MIRFFRSWVLALLALTLPTATALAAEPVSPPCAIAGRPAWHRVKSAHFIVRTSLDAEMARRATLNLERFLAGLLPIWGPTFKLEGPVEVLLVRDTELAEFVQGNVRGFLVTGLDDTRLIIVSLEPAELTGHPLILPTVTHELAHYLLDRVYPRAPRWFSEGFATYLETIQVSADSREAVMAIPKMEHLRYVKAHGVLDMDAMWDWDEDKSLDDPEALQHQYASAWMWVHYLVTRHPQAMERFQLALARVEDPRQAFEAAFGRGRDLEEGLKEHASARRYDAGSYAPPAVPTELEVTVLPHPEVHTIRARLWRQVPSDTWSDEERMKRFVPELQQALREDDHNVEAALLQFPQLDSPQERLKRAQALVKARPDAAGAWTLLGRALRMTQAPLPEQGKAFLRALELSPDSLSTLYDVARWYLDRDLPEKALDPAFRCAQLAPDSAAMRNLLATTLLTLGQCEQGLLHLRRTILLASDSSEAEQSIPALRKVLARSEEACRKAMEAKEARPAKK